MGNPATERRTDRAAKPRRGANAAREPAAEAAREPARGRAKPHAPPPPSQTGARIHAHEAQLDRVLEFVTFVAKPMPLSLLLDEAPRKIAAIVGADVASLYLLEGDGDELVMRGNVGFPTGARGRVRLHVGEGITGMAVECLRPVSTTGAPQHARFRGFPELEEERYPVFLAVPILGHSRPLGALVVQRSGHVEFSPEDTRLMVALTAPIAAGVRHAQLLDDQREKVHQRRTGGGTRKVTLPGVPVVGGRALGAIAALRRPATTPRGKSAANDPRLLRGAFDVAEKALASLFHRATQLGIAADAAFLSTYLLMVSDSRLRERAFELVGEGQPIPDALGTVAREAARTATGMLGDPFLEERARDIEDLCDALLMLASPDARAELPSKAILVGADVSVFDLLVSARAHPVGIALAGRITGPRSRVLLQLLGVPAIADVAGVFRWVSPGDVALLDADHGFLVLNPSRGEVASVRKARRLAHALEGTLPPLVPIDEAPEALEN